MPMTVRELSNLPSTITFTATLTNNSAVLSAVDFFTGLAVGQSIIGTGIESGAVISSIDQGAGTVTLSKVNKGATLSGTICTAEVPGPLGLMPVTPAPAVGLTLTDGGFDYPHGYAPLFNYRPRQVRKFLAARGAAISGKMGGYSRGSTGQPGVYSSNVLIFGDSQAVGNTPVGPDIPLRKHSPSYVASQIIGAVGGHNCDHRAAVFGYNQTGMSEMVGYDSRLAFEGSGWGFDAPDPSMTCTIRNNSTTDYVDFTPEESVDSFDILIRCSTSGDKWSWAIDGGSATEVTVSAGQAGKTVLINVSAGTLGAHTLRLRRVSGASIRFVALIPKDSTRYAVNFINLAIAGAGLNQRSTRITNANYGAAALNTALSPKLVIEQWGYTDIGDSATPLTSIATAITNYGIEVAQWKALGVPIIIATPTPWDDVNLYKDDASQRDYLRALRAFCVAQDLPMINLADRWGSWQEAVSAGFLTHYARPDPQGNADAGFLIAQAIQSL